MRWVPISCEGSVELRAGTPGRVPRGGESARDDRATVTVDMTELRAAGHNAARGSSRRLSLTAGLWIVAAALAGVLLLQAPTALALSQTWLNSVSYNHCLLVFPVSAWFIWRDRVELRQQFFSPWYPGFALIALAMAVWLAGEVANVKSFRDLGLVALVPAVLLTLLGRPFATRAWFPMLFMFFAWPFGEIFIPTMMGWTADFVVGALRFTGVPVLREGNYLRIPTGEWSVVEECSGIRYLMASVSAGAFYAYVQMRSNVRRASFILLALVVPIVANWLRAYFTVLLGHLTNNRLAAGFDHIVYGWVFFGIVMFGLFYVGSLMSDSHGASSDGSGERPGDAPAEGRVDAAPGMSVMVIPAAILSLAVVAVVALWGGRAVSAGDRHAGTPVLGLPGAVGAWMRVSVPVMAGAPQLADGLFSESGTFVQGGTAIAFHGAIGWGNDERNTVLGYRSTVLSSTDHVWHLLSQSVRPHAIGGQEVSINEKLLTDGSRRVLLWQWYRVGSHETGRLRSAKMQVAKNRLAGDEPLAGVLTIYTPVMIDQESARKALADFADAVGPVYAGWFDGWHK